MKTNQLGEVVQVRQLSPPIPVESAADGCRATLTGSHVNSDATNAAPHPHDSSPREPAGREQSTLAVRWLRILFLSSCALSTSRDFIKKLHSLSCDRGVNERLPGERDGR
jgi:hypothetical protein